jgi:hypothetical protein
MWRAVLNNEGEVQNEAVTFVRGRGHTPRS